MKKKIDYSILANDMRGVVVTYKSVANIKYPRFSREEHLKEKKRLMKEFTSYACSRFRKDKAHRVWLNLAGYLTFDECHNVRVAWDYVRIEGPQELFSLCKKICE